jgi:osmotically-inducible protein OsmY
MKPLWFGLSVVTAGVLLMGTSSRAIADESSTAAAVDVKEQKEIRAQLQQAPDLENNRITVTVDDGIAVLEGTVDSQREKKEAQQLAHVDGILGVNNRLQVRAAGK